MTWQEFKATPEALDYWLELPDGLWSRGMANKLPYEVSYTPASKRFSYWEHYKMNGNAPTRSWQKFLE